MKDIVEQMRGIAQGTILLQYPFYEKDWRPGALAKILWDAADEMALLRSDLEYARKRAEKAEAALERASSPVWDSRNDYEGPGQGTMHLSEQKIHGSDSSPDSIGAGAPEPKLEIKITPEMIEAGAEVAWQAPIMEPDEAMIRQMVADVFGAMSLASSLHRS